LSLLRYVSLTDDAPSMSNARKQLFYILQFLYKFTINLTKISILLLYHRVFVTAKFRMACVGVMTYVACFGTCVIIATALECNPVRRVYDKSVYGTCINLTAFWYTVAVNNILTDIVILLMPMPVIQTLRLPPRHKYGLMIVFALGAL
jgi:hypothetical protein